VLAAAHGKSRKKSGPAVVISDGSSLKQRRSEEAIGLKGAAMNHATRPALRFGVFDHLDHAGGSLRQQYNDRLEIAAACDAAGFRAYHVAEHHGTPHGLAASPNLFLSAVAQRTKKLRLGPLVMLLNFYHPLRAFEEICMLDQLSGGRLDLGIGRGAVPLELSFFGVSAAEAQDRYSETAEIVLKAMETDTLTYSGRHFSLSEVPIILSPIQKPHPPLWYGAMKPETARWAAENSINIACVGKSSTVRAITDAYRAHWTARPTRPTQVMPLLGMVRTVVIAGSDSEARALAAPAYARWLETFTFLSRIGNLPLPPNLPKSFEQALDDGFCLAGSPSTVRETLESQVVEAGVTYVMCQIAFGDLPLAASLHTISIMRSTIIPDITAGSSPRSYRPGPTPSSEMRASRE
jgi:alkanesulfonate monooxygenase SsuD/methylene tetrahydromethanopterin reductase-like flavin-dependent oxidoreductase (luciferase family)